MTAFEQELADIPEEDRYRVEERAAMIEFQGAGWPREDAEQMALVDYYRWSLTQTKA